MPRRASRGDAACRLARRLPLQKLAGVRWLGELEPRHPRSLFWLAVHTSMELLGSERQRAAMRADPRGAEAVMADLTEATLQRQLEALEAARQGASAGAWGSRCSILWSNPPQSSGWACHPLKLLACSARRSGCCARSSRLACCRQLGSRCGLRALALDWPGQGLRACLAACLLACLGGFYPVFDVDPAPCVAPSSQSLRAQRESARKVGTRHS